MAVKRIRLSAGRVEIATENVAVPSLPDAITASTPATLSESIPAGSEIAPVRVPGMVIGGAFVVGRDIEGVGSFFTGDIGCCYRNCVRTRAERYRHFDIHCFAGYLNGVGIIADADRGHESIVSGLGGQDYG